MRTFISLALLVIVGVTFAPYAHADHSWGTYHWARTANPFTLKVVDSVTATWDAHLDTAIADWAASSVLNLTKESGSTGSTDRKRCKPLAGKIRVCNQTYGKNGWLGIASIWAQGDHITQGTTKLNDTYFNTATYNTPAWRRLVMCQEIGHDFGLDHQDEGFAAPNLGTCMDYTSDPDGGGAYGPNNEHPNAHDYSQLESMYAHLDASTTIAASLVTSPQEEITDDPRSWGREVRASRDGRASVYQRELKNGTVVLTHVFWVEGRGLKEQH